MGVPEGMMSVLSTKELPRREETVTKLVRDQLIWSNPPISQVRNPSAAQRSCLVNLTVGGSVCSTCRVGTHTHTLSQEDRETEKRGKQPVQTPAVST